MMGISKLPGATKKVRTWASSDGWILNHLAAFDRALARPRPVSADAGWLKAVCACSLWHQVAIGTAPSQCALLASPWGSLMGSMLG